EHLSAYNGIARLTWDPTPTSKLTGSVVGYQSDWDASGQIPLRLVSAGLLNQFGSIDPTEGGRTDRENLDLHYENHPSPTDTWRFQLYGTRYKLRLWSDFTFFASTGLRFIRMPNGEIVDTGDGPVQPGANYIPGDGIYQGDQR